jgi:hypothetical protein
LQFENKVKSDGQECPSYINLADARIIQVRHRSYATHSRQPRQVRKEATVTGSCVCSEAPVPGLFCFVAGDFSPARGLSPRIPDFDVPLTGQPHISKARQGQKRRTRVSVLHDQEIRTQHLGWRSMRSCKSLQYIYQLFAQDCARNASNRWRLAGNPTAAASEGKNEPSSVQFDRS